MNLTGQTARPKGGRPGEKRKDKTPRVLGQRQPPVRDPGHIKFIKQLPCLIRGTIGVDPAHLRQESLAIYGKEHTGGAIKPGDQWTNPLDHDLHALQGDINEYRFWKAAGIDPFKSALALHAVSGNVPRGRRIVLQINTRQICRWTLETERAFGR